MEQPQAPRKKFAGKDRAEGDSKGGRYQPKLLGKAYFQRKKGCPFSGPKAPKIDYKDVRLLQRYLSEYGKMLPRHTTGVSAIKQRELATAIKRARMLALLPFAATVSEKDERRAQRARERGPSDRTDRAPRAPRNQDDAAKAE
ncbi:MAG: 30S ribosomal protein S18 [Pseudomonadaceae bacterium]|nr:30S ribosomal protein S18 [Pseudomonadaceae bacterium]